jgi:hypothetical protein
MLVLPSAWSALCTIRYAPLVTNRNQLGYQRNYGTILPKRQTVDVSIVREVQAFAVTDIGPLPIRSFIQACTCVWESTTATKCLLTQDMRR